MYGTAWSLLPFLIVIPISMWTKQVIPGLAVGLLVGAFMTHPAPVAGLTATLDYLIHELTIPDNMRLVLFLFGFGSLVGLVRVSGGIAGFSRWLESRVRTTKSAFFVTWLSSLATFMAPDFRIITVAPIMKTVFSRLKVPLNRVALVIDITATPLTAVVPIGTAFVGYMIGLLAVANRHHTVALSPFRLFLASIPWNLFAWFALATGLVYTFWPRKDAHTVNAHQGAESTSEPQDTQSNVGNPNRLQRPGIYAGRSAFAVEAAHEPTLATENRVGQREPHPAGHPANAGNDDEVFPDAVEMVAEQVEPRALNLILPLVVLLSLTLFFTWWSGHLKARGVFGALAQADAATAMLEALIVTLIVTVLFYALRKISIGRTMFGFMAGGNEMMGVIVLLALVWGVTAASADLGFVPFTEREVSHLVPPAFIAPILFIAGCLISYVIGSSFGTWAMLLPLGFSLAASTHASIPLVAGAVFASGTFGGFVSPLSDNTVAMATVMKLPLMKYARLKLKIALPAAGLCAGVYAAVGFIA